MKTRLAFALAALPLAACATMPSDEEPERRMPEGDCEASGSQSHVGEKATAELGARLLAETGARVLRWVPPNTAITMEFRPDRLTVYYDDAYVIERITRG